MAETLLKEYFFEPAGDRITMVAPNYATITFGHSTATLEENTDESRWVSGCFEEIKTQVPNIPLKVLVDFSTIDSSEYNSDESNKLYRSMLQDSRIERVAVFGLHTGWTLLINLISIIAPHKLKIFDTEGEARAWLDT